MSDSTHSRVVTVRSPHGLHARPADLIARKVRDHDVRVELVKCERRADASSILEILTLGAEQGTELTIEANGEDAHVVIEALAELIETYVPEDEQN